MLSRERDWRHVSDCILYVCVGGAIFGCVQMMGATVAAGGYGIESVAHDRPRAASIVEGKNGGLGCTSGGRAAHGGICSEIGFHRAR